MGINMSDRALHLARQVVLYNAEVIYFRKHMLTHTTKKITDSLDNGFNRYCILVNNYFPRAEPELIITNFNKPVNFDLIKTDVESIKNYLLETLEIENDKTNIL